MQLSLFCFGACYNATFDFARTGKPRVVIRHNHPWFGKKEKKNGGVTVYRMYYVDSTVFCRVYNSGEFGYENPIPPPINYPELSNERDTYP